MATPETETNAAAATDVRVLCYNVFMRPPFIMDSRDGDSKNERLAHLIPLLDNYDIVCLQEMFGSFTWRQDRFLRTVRTMGFEHTACAPAGSIASRVCNGHLLDGGLVLLSRYPLKDVDFLAFTAAAHSDRLACKGAIAARVHIPGSAHPLELLVTHLQAFYHISDPPATKAKAQQIEEISAFMRERVEGTRGPVLLAGDWNVNSCQEYDTTEYDFMLSRLHKGIGVPFEDLVGVASGPKGPPWTICVSYNAEGREVGTLLEDCQLSTHLEHQRINTDHLLFHSGGVAEVKHARVEDMEAPPGQPYKRLSDHKAVACTLSFFS